MKRFYETWIVYLVFMMYQTGPVSSSLYSISVLNYTYTEVLHDGYVNLNTSVEFLADNASTSTIGSYVFLSTTPPVRSGMSVSVIEGWLNNNFIIASLPLLSVTLTIEEIYTDGFELYMRIDNIGFFTAEDIEATVWLTNGLKADYFSFSNYSIGTGLAMLMERRAFDWTVGTLNVGGSSSDTFEAVLDKENMHDGTNMFSIHVYYSNDTNSPYPYGPVITKVCIDADIIKEKSVLYKHGFTALAFFMAVIVGILLVLLITFIFYWIRKKRTVSPSKDKKEKLVLIRSKTIMMDEHEAVKKKGHSINDYSMVGEEDSIVGVLGMKDKMQMQREIDNLDIVNTVNIDTNLEKERNDASLATTQLIITSLHNKKDIDKNTMNNAVSKMKSRRVHLDKQNDEEYKREMKKLYKKITSKNRSLMENLIKKQKAEKTVLMNNSKHLPTEERNNLSKLMDEQHLAEQNAETYKLKLEQDEETEKLRKEFAVRRRMGLKELQIQALNDVKDQGKLTDAQIKSVLEDHQKNQKLLEGMYDEEISKQRMKLEEKLARRKALAESSETVQEDNDDILKTVAKQQITTIEEMKKNNSISAADANQLIDEAKLTMVAIKENMEKDRANQENDLHKRLSHLKQKRLNDLSKKQEGDLKEYEKQSVTQQTDGPIDPVKIAEGRLKLLSQQRDERNNLENEMDTQHTEELTKLRSELSVQTENEIRGVSDNLKLKLPTDEDTETMMLRLLKQHESETEALRTTQERNRDQQTDKLKERLEESRKQWNKRNEVEKLEQEQLRQYEEDVVSKLVNSQVSMSDDERERILKEHEKQMVKLENSLTLNKLRQKRMMEEKIAQRRAQQMKKLHDEQHSEKETQLHEIENNDQDSDDEDVQKKKLDLMKEHVEQKMALLQGRKKDWDSELESIRTEMMKERSLALKEQEERLGKLVAELQLSKAKELAKIEDQQKTIHNLKTNLIEDLNTKGALSSPETQTAIARHHKEQDELNERLDNQRLQQEKLMKERLQRRLKHREKSMIEHQDEELKTLMNSSKTAAKIKKTLLAHNHMVAMEKMKQQLEREISQTLEQVRYEYDLCKRKAVQNQEMSFIAELVRNSIIPKEDLESLLRTLYPGKSEAEFQEIFNKVFDPSISARKVKPPSKDVVNQLANEIPSDEAHPPPFKGEISTTNRANNDVSSVPSSINIQKEEEDSVHIHH